MISSSVSWPSRSRASRQLNDTLAEVHICACAHTHNGYVTVTWRRCEGIQTDQLQQTEQQLYLRGLAAFLISSPSGKRRVGQLCEFLFLFLEDLDNLNLLWLSLSVLRWQILELCFLYKGIKLFVCVCFAYLTEAFPTLWKAIWSVSGVPFGEAAAVPWPLDERTAAHLWLFESRRVTAPLRAICSMNTGEMRICELSSQLNSILCLTCHVVVNECY